MTRRSIQHATRICRMGLDIDICFSFCYIFHLQVRPVFTVTSLCARFLLTTGACRRPSSRHSKTIPASQCRCATSCSHAIIRRYFEYTSIAKKATSFTITFLRDELQPSPTEPLLNIKRSNFPCRWRGQRNASPAEEPDVKHRSLGKL